LNPRPSPQWFFKQSVQRYESRFRRKVPQWVQALGNEPVRSLVGVAIRLGWKLPPQVLIAEECYLGSESLWSQRITRLDVQTGHLIRNRPMDLMNLPFDPAQAAMRACEKRQTDK
jgi:hypothetical protein